MAINSGRGEMRTFYHVATAAEAFAAAQFARLGFDVSVQYGANQPEYDLIVAQGDRMLKVSVKGSSDGGWGLTQSYMAKNGLATADYHGAIDQWFARHGARTVFCLVQFKNVAFDDMPRIYLATPQEIATLMKASRGGLGHTSLKENHVRGPRSQGAGTHEQIPIAWRISADRVQQLFEGADRPAAASV